MKKVILLAFMAIASMSAFAGVYTSSRNASRTIYDDLTVARDVDSRDYFTTPTGVLFNSIKVLAYAECKVSGISEDGKEALAIARYFATVDEDWYQREVIAAAYAHEGNQEDLLAYKNLLPYLYGSTGKNSIAVQHEMYLPVGMYGSIRTSFTFQITYRPDF